MGRQKPGQGGGGNGQSSMRGMTDGGHAVGGCKRESDTGVKLTEGRPKNRLSSSANQIRENLKKKYGPRKRVGALETTNYPRERELPTVRRRGNLELIRKGKGPGIRSSHQSQKAQTPSHFRTTSKV